MPFEEKKVTCPYNACHQILPHRFGVHLVKCKKQHPHLSVKICPFNVLHHVLTEKYEEHLSKCTDRAIVENNRVVIKHPYDDAPKPIPMGSGSTGSRPGHGQQQRKDPDEEDWEAEMIGVVPYNPIKNAMEKDVFRFIQGATKSQRKAFREEERERHAKLEEMQKSGNSSSILATNTTTVDPSVNQSVSKPLRRPGAMTEVGGGASAQNTSSSTLTRPSFNQTGGTSFATALGGAAAAQGINQSGFTSSFMSSQGTRRPPPPPPAGVNNGGVVPTVGRGRASMIANIVRTHSNASGVGGPGPRNYAGAVATAAPGSVKSSHYDEGQSGTFATSEFRSLDGTDSVISGNL